MTLMNNVVCPENDCYPAVNQSICVRPTVGWQVSRVTGLGGASITRLRISNCDVSDSGDDGQL